VKFFSVKKNPFAGLGRNVAILGLVSFFTDASSDMIYLCSPSLLPSPWGQARQAILGLIEGVAESTASLVKLFSGWLSDKLQKRKSLAVAGYALASLTRPLIAMALASWHVFYLSDLSTELVKVSGLLQAMLSSLIQNFEARPLASIAPWTTWEQLLAPSSLWGFYGIG